MQNIFRIKPKLIHFKKKKHVIEIFYNIIDMSNYSEIKINKTLKLRIQIQGFVNKII